jgi:hypothetical protein
MQARAAGTGGSRPRDAAVTGPGSRRTSSRLAALGVRPVFTVESVTYSWNDVLTWAAALGKLDELSAVTARGLVLARRAAERGDLLDAPARSAAANAFRYERRLLSAEELAAWLERWELTVTEWGEHLERRLLLDGGCEPGEVSPLSGDAVAEAEYVEAVCTGFLERAATGFAADVALAEPTVDELGDERATTIERIVAAAAVAREGAKTAVGVEREIARRGLDWTRLELDLLELDEAGAAREAAMCVRIDGRELADVAADCRLTVSHQSAYLADLEPWLNAPLLAAQAGELVGPLRSDEVWVLVAIGERTQPLPTDQGLRERAEAALVERAVKRATEGRVEWHEHL